MIDLTSCVCIIFFFFIPETQYFNEHVILEYEKMNWLLNQHIQSRFFLPTNNPCMKKEAKSETNPSSEE